MGSPKLDGPEKFSMSLKSGGTISKFIISLILIYEIVKIYSTYVKN